MVNLIAYFLLNHLPSTKMITWFILVINKLYFLKKNIKNNFDKKKC